MKSLFVPSDNQKEVININSGYNLVLAGPGCGKTQILAERIAYAYDCQGLDLSNALCLTFTNRAARGMYARVLDRLGEKAGSLFIGNVHRYCSHFLFKNKCVPQGTSIASDDDFLMILERAVGFEDVARIINANYEDGKSVYGINWDIVRDLFGIEDYSITRSGSITRPNFIVLVNRIRMQIARMSHLIEQVLNNIPEDVLLYKDLWQNSDIQRYCSALDKFRRRCLRARDLKVFPEDWIDQYLFLSCEFSRYKEAMGVVDFDDLLVKTYVAYGKDHENKFKRYQWIQVDEVQDLSPFQIALIELLSKKDSVVVYFGDEQQAIYSFMGASLAVLERLKIRCGNIFRLDKNFRSPKYLLDVLNEYAVRQLKIDGDLLPKAKDNCSAGQDDLRLVVCGKEEEEETLINEVRNFNRYGERTAILVPWNRDATEISQYLEGKGIDHFRISGRDIFRTVAMRMLIAHFNVINNPLNVLSWGYILYNTFAIKKLGDAYDFVLKMRKLGMTPEDLLREDGSTYTGEFCNVFENDEFVVFDTETTGLDVVNDDIVQIAAIKVRRGVVVPNSSFNVFLETDKLIPDMLGDKVNPMVDAYRAADKVSRQEGLRRFCEYVGSLSVMGHNVSYDFNILRYNLRRLSMEGLFKPRMVFDSLFLTRMLKPKLPMYKLEFLLEHLGLAGVNSHMANDDVLATFELVKYCYKLLRNKLDQQINFINSKECAAVRRVLKVSYKDSYLHTKDMLWNDCGNSCAVLVLEMKYIHDRMVEDCELAPVPYFDKYILKFIESDVLLADEQNVLASQLASHLMDLNTYKESDLCDSAVMDQKIFVSTIHKAKGLEFENVIIMRANDNRFPKFSSDTTEKIQEDKRLFYVAMSRAMKRLTICGVLDFRDGLTNFVDPIKHNFNRVSG